MLTRFASILMSFVVAGAASGAPFASADNVIVYVSG